MKLRSPRVRQWSFHVLAIGEDAGSEIWQILTWKESLGNVSLPGPWSPKMPRKGLGSVGRWEVPGAARVRVQKEKEKNIWSVKMVVEFLKLRKKQRRKSKRSKPSKNGRNKELNSWGVHPHIMTLACNSLWILRTQVDFCLWTVMRELWTTVQDNINSALSLHSSPNQVRWSRKISLMTVLMLRTKFFFIPCS